MAAAVLSPVPEDTVSGQIADPNRTTDDSLVARLAQFFPEVTPVRIPVRVSGHDSRGTAFAEDTVIEFGTPGAVLFASRLALEFGDKVRLRSSGISLDAEATIVAVQYHDGQTAVAARFLRPVAHWIIQR